MRHQKTLEDLSQGQVLKDQKTSTERDSARRAGDPLLIVRSAYNVKEKLAMKRFFEVGSPYLYKVVVLASDKTVGFCRQVGANLVFYNIEEKELLEIDATELLGRSSLAKTRKLFLNSLAECV